MPTDFDLTAETVRDMTNDLASLKRWIIDADRYEDNRDIWTRGPAIVGAAIEVLTEVERQRDELREALEMLIVAFESRGVGTSWDEVATAREALSRCSAKEGASVRAQKGGDDG